MTQVLVVGAGGFIGSVLRYWLSGLVQRSAHDIFPAGTLIVNLVGCLLMGLLWGLVEYGKWFRPETRLFLATGILGGFTTFSTFGFETFALVHDRQYVAATANVVASVVIGILAVFLGWMAGKALAA